MNLNQKTARLLTLSIQSCTSEVFGNTGFLQRLIPPVVLDALIMYSEETISGNNCRFDEA